MVMPTRSGDEARVHIQSAQGWLGGGCRQFGAQLEERIGTLEAFRIGAFIAGPLCLIEGTIFVNSRSMSWAYHLAAELDGLPEWRS